MDNDLKIEQLRAAVINAVNSSDLSISVIYYVLKPIMDEIEAAYVKHAQVVYQQSQAAAADNETEEVKEEE